MDGVTQVAEGVWRVTAGGFPSNSFICATPAAGEAILVDVGLDAAPIEAALAELRLRPVAVCCTHGHFDHLGTAAHFQVRWAIPVYLHRDDRKTVESNNFLLLAMNRPERVSTPELTLIDHEAEIVFAGAVLRYRHTPGHTPGSAIIEFGDQLFTGDTLYARGVGLSKLPGERPEGLRASIRSIWHLLERFTVHPGHGPSAPGAQIRTENRALLNFLGLAA